MKDFRTLTELERLLYRELFKKDAYSFCCEFWEEIDNHKMKKSNLIKFFCEVFQYECRHWVKYEKINIDLPKLKKNEKLIDVRENKYLLNISCPPRHGKSNLFNILLPCWLFVNEPIKIASVSHTQGLAGTMNMKRQKLLNSDKFKFFFPEIQLTQNTTYSLRDTRNGEMYSVPKNSITGFGADILLIDDLTNVATAIRDAQEMESSWKTYTETLPSRVNDPMKHVIINIMQRIAVNDIVGRIQKDAKMSSAYTFVSLPAQFKKTTLLVCPISGDIITYKKGDFLFPEQFGNYETIKSRITEHTWKAQYLQEPENSDLAVIKPDMIIEKTLNEVPSIDNADIIYASHDFPVKDKDTSDYLGSLLGYRIGGNLYLVDCLEKRLAFTRSVDYVKSLDDNYPGIIQIIEDKANGAPILQALQDIVPGMQAFNPGANSKMQRLESASLYMNNVIFIKSSLNENNEYVLSKSLQNLKERLLAFPFVEHDDIVDAFSMMCLFVFIDKRYMVYGRAFNDKNITNVDSSKYDYSTIFFNKEGDVWKACEIFIDYSLNTKLLVSKEMRFKGSIEDGLKALKEFAPKKKMFIDCSATPALTGTYTKDIVIERYEIEDFDKSVTQLNLALDKSLVLLDKSCKLIKSDIESFKFSKTKDDTVKYATIKDGFVSCLRTALRYFGGIV